MSKKYNILVTGVGAIIGYGVIESLRLSGIDCTIIATDIYDENFGKYCADVFVQVPYTSDPNYSKIIHQIIDTYKIDLVFPAIEQDVFYFNQNSEKFPATKFVLNKNELINLSKDKLLMFEFLKANKYADLIPTYIQLNFEEAAQKLGLPFIIKPKSSYASKGFYIIKDEEDYQKVSKQVNESTLFQPLIGTIDDEYTIAIFGDGQGSYIDSIILRRYLSAAGASEKTFVIPYDKEIMESIDFLVKLFKPIGATNFQFRKADNKAYLLEINPRISSSCSIRTKFGYNDALYSVQHYLQNNNYTILPKKQGKAIRYIADEIIYE